MHANGSLFVGEKKISGHAQYAAANRLLSHGTLLFDADLERLSPALQPRARPIQSIAVSSIRSPVMNLRPLLPAGYQLADLQQAILQELFGDEITEYELTVTDNTAIRQMVEERYRSWEWVYGRNPRFVLERNGRCPEGLVEIRLEINKGCIIDLDIYCDFFHMADPKPLVNQLVGCRYQAQTLLQKLQQNDLTRYFGSISAAEFLGILY